MKLNHYGLKVHSGLVLKSLEISKKVLGDNHPDYAIALGNFAELYYGLGNYQKAEFLYLQSLETLKLAFGENHPAYATFLNNLAEVYYEQREYKKAEPIFIQSLEIRKNILGKDHPNSTNSLYNLAKNYDILGEFKKTAYYFQNSFLPFQNQIKQAYSYQSEKELSFFGTQNYATRFLALSFLYRNPIHYIDINIGCYENELLVSNLSLRNRQQIVNEIKKCNDKELQDIYQQYILNKKNISKFNELPLDKRPTNYNQINSENEIIEKELVRKVASFSDANSALSLNWRKVQDKLKSTEIVIDLVTFQYHNKKWTDSIAYAAFILKKDSKFPELIALFEQNQLDFLLSKNNKQTDNAQIDKQYIDHAISDLFLKPLEKELNGISTVYLSPSGLGHQINFSTLPISETESFGEKYNLHILSSTAELIDYKVSKIEQKNNTEILLYGGINYNKSNPKTKKNDELVEPSTDILALRTRSGITGFDYLNGTNNEVDQIQLKAKKNGFSALLLKENEGTEESIKALDGRKISYVLHLATHGFFFADTIQEKPKDLILEQGKSQIYKASDDPMMRSGLLFAGANKYWGKSTENNTTDDGILTASEISNLDLSTCQLVVLSACETGLGEINGSEGIFGLQRAFKMAGVKNIIMSLWKVPDTQTAELFDIFYSECFIGKSIHEAFKNAQSKMKTKYSPYYWAGFVLLE